MIKSNNFHSRIRTHAAHDADEPQHGLGCFRNSLRPWICGMHDQLAIHRKRSQKVYRGRLFRVEESPSDMIVALGRTASSEVNGSVSGDR